MKVLLLTIQIITLALMLVYLLMGWNIWVTHGTTRYWINFSAHHYDGRNWDIYIAICKHNFSIFIRR